MGRIESDSVIFHFSHEHPLKLLNIHPQIPNTITCSGCKRSNVSGAIYVCDLCNYYLHKTCSNLPQTHIHQVDQEHPLILLSTPAYPEGKFECNACGCPGNGFSYHCQVCELDLHPICAFMPMEVNHFSHSHPLKLCFIPPYHNNIFSCDICKKTGSNHWLYRCNSCEFDAHLKCAKSNARSISQPMNQPQVILNKSRSAPQPQATQYQEFSPHPPLATPQMQPQYSFPGNGFSVRYDYQQVPDPYVYGPAMGIPQYTQNQNQNQNQTQAQIQTQTQPSRGNNIVNGLVESAVDGFVNQAAQTLFQAVINS